MNKRSRQRNKVEDHPQKPARRRRRPSSGAELTATDHAIVRYVERVLGIDRDEIIKKILPPDEDAAVRGLGSGVYPIGESHRIVVEDDRIVTVLPRYRDAPR